MMPLAQILFLPHPRLIILTMSLAFSCLLCLFIFDGRLVVFDLSHNNVHSPYHCSADQGNAYNITFTIDIEGRDVFPWHL